ncbi:Ubiquitin carboxyl-terminal hydrolase 7 [Puccinia graminis f. sp. tritici]|uniref:Ubiquitin carboxyl-terminal hydrolase 7 n=1 Tax=Puccinia graminis f. sp. tritici TaxID=56615 RepID=A0A5B0NQX0_PUCGR|nr:Ubiquitin carboxyl-terminal hydrolase 7 [Puccinia graminis f. sp. tritici]
MRQMSATIEFSLVLSKKDTYEEMSKLVSAKLNHSPENLRFTGSLKGFPQNVIHGQRVPTTCWHIFPESHHCG